jgi:diguanylate cyclase (GGDEF)-like protein
VGLTTIVIAAAALGVILVLAGVLVRQRQRSARAGEVKITEALGQVSAQVDRLTRDLSTALERAESEERRRRVLADLGTSIDLEEVLERVVDAVLRLSPFEAATVALDDGGGSQVVVSRGLTTTETEGPATPSPGAPARTVVATYRYAAREEGMDPIRGGVFVPLGLPGSQRIGTLAAYWRAPVGEPSPEEIEALEDLAQSSSAAIENARRYREARQAAETDALTGLYNQRYFHEMLRREVSRATRYGRQLALIVFDLDDLKAINDRIGHLAGDAVLAQAAERILGALRSSDIACRIGGDEFAVILPESSGVVAEHLYRRIQDALADTALAGDGGRLGLSAGIAELRRGDNAAMLFERADSALYRSKQTGKGRVSLADDLPELPTT